MKINMRTYEPKTLFLKSHKANYYHYRDYPCIILFKIKKEGDASPSPQANQRWNYRYFRSEEGELSSILKIDVYILNINLKKSKSE